MSNENLDIHLSGGPVDVIMYSMKVIIAFEI